MLRRYWQQCVRFCLVVFPCFFQVILSFSYCCFNHTWLVTSTTRNRRHVVGMMSLYGYICLIYIAVQILLITVQMPKIYSRDQLLPLRACATQLNHDQCLRITQLGLRRRGCRAGNHVRLSRQSACSVTSSTRRTFTRGEIPVIISHRPLFTNNNQLFSGCRGERCRPVRTSIHRCSALIRPRPLIRSSSSLPSI